jgi:hypothetical protein
MEIYDIKKLHRSLYAPSATDFELVDVPEIRYLAIDGHGDPNTSPDYARALEALYAVAYTARFAAKSDGRTFTVAPLEGLWRADDPEAFTRRDKHTWAWTMMIAMPDWLSAEQMDSAREAAARKKDLPAAESLRLLVLHEGLSAQILHKGSYDDEAPTLHRLHHEFLPAHGLTFNGDHHEIYLSDPRRSPPDKLKTILRQPVRPV